MIEHVAMDLVKQDVKRCCESLCWGMSYKCGINVKQQSFGKPDLAHETLILALHFGALIRQRRCWLRGQSGSGFRRCPCWGPITGGRLAVACRGSGRLSDTMASRQARTARPSLGSGLLQTKPFS